MKDKDYNNLKQAQIEAQQTIEDISQERQIKGNENVAAGRYGDLVANMVKYAESQKAMEMMHKEDMPGQNHIEPEARKDQNVINPS